MKGDRKHNSDMAQGGPGSEIKRHKHLKGAYGPGHQCFHCFFTGLPFFLDKVHEKFCKYLCIEDIIAVARLFYPIRLSMNASRELAIRQTRLHSTIKRKQLQLVLSSTF